MEAVGWFFLGFIWGVALWHARTERKERRRSQIDLYIDGKKIASDVHLARMEDGCLRWVESIRR